MKYLLAIIFLVLTTCNPVYAFDEWTNRDTVTQAAYATVHGIDWLQTREIAEHPQSFYEKNPILGLHPTRGRVDVYFATTYLLHHGIAYVLPKEYRANWQNVWIGLELATIVGNYTRVNIKVGF